MVLAIRLLTVQDYHRMAEAGIFHPEERVELIAGQIIQIVAKGTAHESAITRTDRLLRNCQSFPIWAEIFTVCKRFAFTSNFPIARNPSP